MDAKLIFEKVKASGKKIAENEHVKRIGIQVLGTAAVTTAAILVTAGLNAGLDAIKNGLAKKTNAELGTDETASTTPVE